MKAILERRSIRKYVSQPVPDEIIKKLLTAAMCAPSASNRRPVHYIVIKDRRILYEIPKLHPYSSMLREAPVAIMICGDLKLDNNSGFWVQDCSAATENLLIAAQAKGLGAVWLGIYPVKERVYALQNLLRLPEDIIPLSLVPVGYPGEEKPPINRYDESRVHFDSW